METLHSTLVTSPVGPLFLATSVRGLVALEFDQRLPGQQTIRPNPRDLRAESQKIRFEDSAHELGAYVRELEEYFAGTRQGKITGVDSHDRSADPKRSAHVHTAAALTRGLSAALVHVFARRLFAGGHGL